MQEQIAHLLLAKGDDDGALRHFRRAGEVCPNNPRFHSLLGTFLLNRNNLDDAAAAYARTLQADSLDSYGLKMGLLTANMPRPRRTALTLARRLLSVSACRMPMPLKSMAARPPRWATRPKRARL